jgi:putative acetyltransferase
VIRPEHPDDYATIRALHRAAFAPSEVEAEIVDGLRAAGETDFALIALLGHPAYYPRFGFVPAAETLGVTTAYDAPPEAWMAHPLPAYEPGVRGAFHYAAAFGGG